MGRSPAISADVHAKHIEISGLRPSHYLLTDRFTRILGRCPPVYATAELIFLDKGRSLAISADVHAKHIEISGRWPSYHRIAIWGYKDFGALPLGLCTARIVLVDKGRIPAILVKATSESE